jgi:ketosteroid isomerase-like protein
VSAFREAVGRHLLAIDERDIDALAATLSPDGVLLIMSDGRLTRTAKEFVDGYRAWFAMKNWRLEVKPVQIFEGQDLGVALMLYELREMPPGGVPTRQVSLVSLVFRSRNGAWLMVQNQNTPMQK